MKKFIVLVSLLALTFSLSACSTRTSNEETTDETAEVTSRQETTTPRQTTENTSDTDTAAGGSDTESDKRITEEEAVEAAKAYLGNEDPATGYKYSYASQGTMQDTDTGENFYKVRVSWYLPEDDRYSVCGYLLVSGDGKTITKFDW